MRYAQIRETDIANGVGIRTSLFVQGCPLHCPNCFNEEFQDFSGGREWNETIQQKFIDLGKRSFIVGYSILGGEPMAQDEQMLNLLQAIKKQTGKSIWMWTGYTFETLTDFQKSMLPYLDYLVDGRFVEELKDPKLRFRGSSNQRIINVPRTLETGKLTEWNAEYRHLNLVK